MKKGIIIVNSYAEVEGIGYQSKRLTAEFSSLGVKLSVKKTDEVALAVRGGAAEAPLDADFVIFLDKDSYCARLIEKSGIKMFNSAAAIEVCDDKMLTHIALAGGGINMPLTIPSLLCYTKGAAASEKFLKRVEGELKFPLVGKSSFGSLGQGVFLIKNAHELRAFEENFKYKPHLYQEYISSSSGMDIRVIVIGGKALAAMRRFNNEDFRSNMGGGGAGEGVSLKPDFAAAAERAAKILGLDYCGADLLIGEDGSPVLCEVNSNAFFTGFEKCTGVNVAAEYARYIYGKIYGVF